MRQVLVIMGVAAASAALAACALISGLDHYSAGGCARDCEAGVDVKVPPDSTTDVPDGGDATVAEPDADLGPDALGDEDADTDLGVSGCEAGLAACDGACVSLATTLHCGTCDNACPTSLPNSQSACVDGRCTATCNLGYNSCGESCVEYTTASNCGGCGSTCTQEAGAPLCALSADAGTYACTSGCPTSTPDSCGSACVDETSDPRNCAACGHACTTSVANALPVCVRSACTFACQNGFHLCNGACVQYSNAANCGSCGNACSGDGGAAVCAGSAGQYACVSGCPAAVPTLCTGTCVDTTRDPSNCGGCGAGCSSGVANAQDLCADGGCAFTCESGYTLCNGSCVSLATAANCGACGRSCDPDGGSPFCAPGSDGGVASCASGCPTATPVRCSGSCVDTASDVHNCGGCGLTCSTNVANAHPACSAATCTVGCDAGYTLCNGACVDITTDNNNCGGCGSLHACGAGTTCRAGACTTRCLLTSDCPPGYACNGSTCTTACSQNQPCNGGCCSGGTCVTGTAGAACGANGGLCTSCAGQSVGKACVSGLCGCSVAADCPSLAACSLTLHSCQGLCGGANTGCNGGCCTNLATGGACVAGALDTQCGGSGGQCLNCQSTCNAGTHCTGVACGCLTSFDCVLSSCASRNTCASGSCGP